MKFSVEEGGNNSPELFICSKNGCNKSFEKGFEMKKNGQRISGKRFCSRKHGEDYLKEIEQMNNRVCSICKSKGCFKPVCESILMAISELEDLSHYVFFSSSEREKFSEKFKEGQYYYEGDEFCKVDEEGVINGGYLWSILQKAKVLNENKKNEIDQEMNSYLQQLKNLDGWDLFNNEEQQDVIEDMKRCRQTDQFNNLLQKIKEKIKKIKAGEGGGSRNNKNLPIQIQNSIKKIETELNQEPKIIWAKTWKEYLKSSSNLTELKNREQELLGQIQTIRVQQGGGQNQNLTEFRAVSIHLIKQELEKNSISASELTNPDWENDLNEATSESAVLEIRNQVLGNIKNIKDRKEKNFLNELLIQAHQPENWNNYQNLQNILQRIKQLYLTSACREKAAEIQALETQLQILNPTKYTQQVATDLQQQVENNGLTEAELSEDTKDAIAQAKQTGDPIDKHLAEEKIAHNGARVNLGKLLVQAQTALSSAKSNLEKEQLAQVIELFINQDDYKKAAYLKQKPKIDQLLKQLRGEPQKQTPTTPPQPTWSWPKALGMGALVIIPVVLVSLIIIYQRKKESRKKIV